jgi:hypothetical protein
MNPTKGVIEDIELPCIITDNNQTFGEAVMKHATDKGTLCGYFDVSMINDLQLL